MRFLLCPDCALIIPEYFQGFQRIAYEDKMLEIIIISGLPMETGTENETLEGLEALASRLKPPARGQEGENMKERSEIEAGLGQFIGSETVYRHRLSGLAYTEGVQWLAESADCYWLIDLVGSYQKQCGKDRMLSVVQFWTLSVNLEKRSAVVICERDEGDKNPIRQEIEFSDFPLPSIRLWVRDGILLLPSEY